MIAAVAKQWLQCNEEDWNWIASWPKFELQYIQNLCHSHTHGSSFRTGQKQKSTILMKGYADTGKRDMLYF